jgi:hypothetical protein
MVVRDDGYKGNPNLLRAGTVYAFTQEEALEYAKCRKDIVYFIETYMKIVTLDHGIQPFKMWDFQKQMVNNFHSHRFNICKLPRQVGKSTVSVAYMLHYILFNQHVEVAILANKAATAREILSRLKLAYEKLPKFLQAGIKEWNKGGIELGNGSTIIAESTAADSIRGFTFNLIFLDEFAFVPNNLAEEFFNSTYPTITSGTSSKMIIVSTPKGMNHFYKMWEEASQGKSEYHPYEIHWSMVPGRDKAWKEQVIRNTSQKQFQQEFECEFLGSSDTLISGAKLGTLVPKTPIQIEPNLKIYELPKPDNVYVVTVDTSEGIGKDYACVMVHNVTDYPFTQAAVYRNNEISAMMLPNPIMHIAKKYNDAYVLIELNNTGQQVSDILYHDLAYENIFTTRNDTRNGQHLNYRYNKNQSYGLKMSVATKRIGCNNLKTLIEDDKYIVNDEITIDELMTFVARRNSYMAEEGKNDDTVMNLVLLGWLSTQQLFKDTMDVDIRKKIEEEKMNLKKEEELPFAVTPETEYYNPHNLDMQNSEVVDGDRWFPV